MSEVTQRQKDPVQRQGGGGGKDPAEGGSRFPVQLRGAGLEAQERGLMPDAQPGFEAADAARRPVQKRAAEEKQAGGGEEKAAKPATVSYVSPAGRGASLAVVINRGQNRGFTKGEPISWGHCQGVIDEVYEWRSLVVFKGIHPSGLSSMLERFGGTLDVGPPKHSPPKAEEKEALGGAGGGGGAAGTKAPPAEAAKKPKFAVIPGTPSARKMAAGRTGASEVSSIKLPFRHGVIGAGKWNADAIDYSGSFTDADMAAEVLDTLKRITSYDTSLQELTDADLAPQVAKLVAALKTAL